MTETSNPSATPENGEAVATTPPASDTPKSAIDLVPGDRDEVASRLVDRFAVWSGVAGLIPVPFVDVLCVGGLQVQMLRRISQIYDVAFSENRGKALISALAGALIPAASGMGAASALKAVPILGTFAGGVVMPVLSAGATYAIGKAFIQHFASGGTLLDFNPPDYREFVKAHKEMWDKRTTGSPPRPAEGDASTSTGATATGS